VADAGVASTSTARVRLPGLGWLLVGARSGARSGQSTPAARTSWVVAIPSAKTIGALRNCATEVARQRRPPSVPLRSGSGKVQSRA
jgi:hypothetical protein